MCVTLFRITAIKPFHQRSASCVILFVLILSLFGWVTGRKGKRNVGRESQSHAWRRLILQLAGLTQTCAFMLMHMFWVCFACECACARVREKMLKGIRTCICVCAWQCVRVCIVYMWLCSGVVFKPINLSTLCLVYMFRCANVFALCVCLKVVFAGVCVTWAYVWMQIASEYVVRLFKYANVHPVYVSTCGWVRLRKLVWLCIGCVRGYVCVSESSFCSEAQWKNWKVCNEEVKIIPGLAPLAAAVKLPVVWDLLPSPGSCCVTHSWKQLPSDWQRRGVCCLNPQVGPFS